MGHSTSTLWASLIITKGFFSDTHANSRHTSDLNAEKKLNHRNLKRNHRGIFSLTVLECGRTLGVNHKTGYHKEKRCINMIN